jgi:hypothetical protein
MISAICEPINLFQEFPGCFGLVSGCPRLFDAMRTSRQTELQCEFPLHVVCSWLGNSPRIVQQSYLLVTEEDFSKAAGVAKVMVEG